MPTEPAEISSSRQPARPRVGASSQRLVRGIDHTVAYWELLSNLVARDLKTRYRGSVLGVFWSLLNPLLLMLVYTVVFSVIVRVNIQPYPIFLLSGLVPWNIFAQTLTIATTSVTDNAGIVRKVYFPLVILPLSAVASTAVHFLISLGLLAVLAIMFQVGIGISLVFLPLLLVLQILFSTGVGCLLAAGQVYFRDVQYFLSVLVTVWFFGTPIVYSLDLVPHRLRPFFEANPMAWLVSSYQDIWFYRRMPSSLHLVGFAAVAVVVAFVGLSVYDRLSRGFAEEV
jgi:ABC-2 type transport system permease protein